MKNVIILGTGISGLSLGWYLKKKHGKDVSLTFIDQAPRVGGLIQSLQKDGYLFELGPHSCRTAGNGHVVLELIEDLGLTSEVIYAHPEAKKRFLWHQQQLMRLPNNPLKALWSPLLKGLIPALIRDWKAQKSDAVDETIYSFFSRHFGSELTERLVDPVVSGIFGGSIHQLSARSCFPELFQLERTHGSILKGLLKKRKKKQPAKKGAIFSLKHGMESLPQAIQKHLEATYMLSTPVHRVMNYRHQIAVDTSQGILEADQLFSTLPAHALETLLPEEMPSLKRILSQWQTTSFAVISMGFQEKVLPEDGFGYLVPSAEKEKILGIVWDSSVFPEQNRSLQETRLTVMMGGAHHPELLEQVDAQLCEVALEAIKRQLGIKTSPTSLHLHRVRNAIPQYVLGHDERVKKVEELISREIPLLTIAGSSFYGAGIPQCVAKSHEIASHCKS